MVAQRCQNCVERVLGLNDGAMECVEEPSKPIGDIH
jgi:hypothetical protein